jgi:hypothetical protein
LITRRAPKRHARLGRAVARAGEQFERAAAVGFGVAIMLAHGFTIEFLVELIRAGLATAKAERVVAGGRTVEVARVRITEAGRQAFAER